MNILMVNNLSAGIGEPSLYDYVAELGAHGAEVTMRFLDSTSNLDHLLRDARGYDRVVAVGGDGTVSSIAYALRDTRVPLLTYPAGTANLLVRNLRLPVDPVALARLTIAGRTASIDLGELFLPSAGQEPAQRLGFAVAAGAGFDASIMNSAASMKGAIGETAYIVAALQNLAPRVAEFTLEFEDRTVLTDGIAVLIVNLGHIQFDLALTHGSSPQDGLLEVIVVRARSAAGLLPTVLAAMRDKVVPFPHRPGLETYSATRVRVVARPDLPIESDGETYTRMTPIEARVLPGAARLIVGEECPFETELLTE